MILKNGIVLQSGALRLRRSDRRCPAQVIIGTGKEAGGLTPPASLFLRLSL